MTKLVTKPIPARPFVLAPLAAALALSFGGAWAGTTTYTLDGQFDLGTLQNVNHSAPNSDQLQLNLTGTGFPTLWIANAGEDTLSKFDTTQINGSPGREVARYHTWFSSGVNSVADGHSAWGGPAPSRTAVDIEGNAYVLNRHFDGRSAVLFKILANGFIDRNGNGVADTSTDANNDGVIQAGEMMPLLDNNANAIIDPSEIQDERIAWAVRVPDGVAAPLRTGRLGRSLCIGTDGNLWVGLYSDATYYKVSAADGHTIIGPVSTTPTVGYPNAGSWTPYGCLIDKNGVLWSASLGSRLGKIENTASNTGPYPVSSWNGPSNYGIALGVGPANQTLVYLGGTSQSYTRFDSATNTFSNPADLFFSANGVNTDGAGNILVSKSGGGVAVFEPINGAVVWNVGAQSGTASDSRGIMPDANNDVWQVHLGANKISKFRGTDGTALGVLPTGISPYTYSDASGFAAANITVSTGTWTVIQDGGGAGTPWGKVSWNALIPTGASVGAKVRTADSIAALGGQSFVDVGNGVSFNLAGQFIEVQVRLTANNQGESPIVYDVTVASVSQGKCDVDKDGDIDKNDLALITKARGQTPTADDPRDADGDGAITSADVKACIPLCTRPSCATQ
jgi:hypothetical protein